VTPDRYEPLPSLGQLPTWLWRRSGPRSRLAAGLTLLFVATAVAVVVPAQRRDAQARTAAEQHQREVRHRATVQALVREQRPRFGTSAASARPAMLRDLEAAILADARARQVEALRVACEPFPKTLGDPPPERDPRVARGSYSCLAVTDEIQRSEATVGGTLGEPYRAGLDFATGRYALCKIAGRPDPIAAPEVTTPPECAGGRLPAP
jgi:hypothetical protein